MGQVAEDKDLILAIQQGRIEQFEILVRKYQGKLLHFAGRYLKNNTAACQDIVQDTFIALYKNIDKVDTKKKLSTYLFEITKNKALNYLAKNKRLISLDAIAQPQYELNYDYFDFGDKFKKLKTIYQKVLQFYYIEDKSYKDIAHTLSLPLNTVRTHLNRAKKAFKHIYES